MQYQTLPSGARMPLIGLGTYEELPDDASHILGHEIMARALRVGYRHIDSAIYYENHDGIRQALVETGIDRSEVFITSKVHRQQLAYDDVLAACEQVLKELDTDYLDLYLLHWPNNDVPMEPSFRALGRLVNEGIVRDIGVANYTRINLRKALDVVEGTGTTIAVNQVEFHAYLNQEALLEFCCAHSIHVTAYAPIAQARILDEPVLQQIAANHDKSPIQVGLRWLIQKGLSAVPKSTSEAHLAANLDVFDWELSGEQMHQIDTIGKRMRIFDWDVVAEFSKDV